MNNKLFVLIIEASYQYDQQNDQQQEWNKISIFISLFRHCRLPPGLSASKSPLQENNPDMREIGNSKSIIYTWGSLLLLHPSNENQRESVDVAAMWSGGGGSGSLINLIGLCNIMMTYQSSCPPSIQQMGHPGLHTQNIYFVLRFSDSGPLWKGHI